MRNKSVRSGKKVGHVGKKWDKNVVETGEESTSSDIGFDWLATEIDAYKLTFQLTFDNPV